MASIKGTVRLGLFISISNIRWIQGNFKTLKIICNEESIQWDGGEGQGQLQEEMQEQIAVDLKQDNFTTRSAE